MARRTDLVRALAVVAMVAACGGDDDSSGGDGGSGGDGSTPGADAAPKVDSGMPPVPSGECTPPVDLADTSSPTAVVGDGSAASCTEAALDTALAGGGIITFDCGSAPHTIAITSEKAITNDTVIDGGGTITLDGGNATRILEMTSSFELATPSLTVQRLTFKNGKSPLTGEDTADGGGAIHRRGGTLVIIDSAFVDNEAPLAGQDIAGGAVYSVGSAPTTIVGSSFIGNRASNGGAIGNLQNDFTIVNSVLQGNSAMGTGGNPGNGGNGGAIYIDGVDQDVTMCGVELRDNNGNAFGGGLFRVSNNGVGTHVIDRSTIDGNKIPDQSPSKAGGLYLQGMAITITNTTISNNEATSDGGMFAGPNATISMANVTIAGNTALSSLGGGMSIAGGVTGTITNCTFANNKAPGPVAFAAATVGGDGVVMKNTIVDGHEVGNGYNPISCRDQLMEGGGNLQFPVMRSGSGSDDPGALCTSGILVSDSLLGTLSDNGGPTLTLVPQTGSPAIAHGTGCPATDQRGQARSEPCTSGAVEVSP